MKIPVPSLDDFLAAFPAHALPVTLREDSISDFERLGDPLPEALVYAFLMSEDEEPDPFTEYVPCFRIPDTHDFHAIVFWKGELMKYQYFLSTFDKKGNPIANAVIAGLQSDGELILRSITTIEENWRINIVEGEQPATTELYSPANSRSYQMELLSTGEIALLEDE